MSNTDKSKAITASVPGATTLAASAPAKPPAVDGVPVSAGPTLVPTPSVGAVSDDADEKDKIQYFVIVGETEVFQDVREAEKFLNSPEAPECTVIYGKVSLVNEWHITTGVIHSFKSLAKAQKFLKDFPAIKDFVMIRGRITVPEVRVSLRG